MVSSSKVLVLAGAREAHAIIARLQSRKRNVIASLPEPERIFGPLTVPTRIGSFEGKDAMQVWFEENRVSCVIDASHSFDSDVSNNAADICSRLELRYARVLRPEWHPMIQDRWTRYGDVQSAAGDVPGQARVFCNTGRASLPDLAGFSGEILFLRQTEKPPNPPPYPFVKYVFGAPPFSQSREASLFRELKVSMLICRNVGGAASMSKILAARQLGLRVSMIDRPRPPAGMPLVETVAEALAWEADS